MGALKEYIMPDGNTYQFWDCDVPPEAKPVEQPKESKPAAKTTASKRAAK